MKKIVAWLLGCLTYTIMTNVAYAECFSGNLGWLAAGEDTFTVPADCNSITIQVWGAGGGGMGAEPWGTGTGGNGGFIEAKVPVISNTTYRIIVGEGGKGASCGGGTNGGGGGGHSSLLDMNDNPLVSAGGGGGGHIYTPPCHGGSSCSLTDQGNGGFGYGGAGKRSDDTATDGQPGNGPPNFLGGISGSNNCGANSGNGGFGGGGGSGGTHNGFGGGGGGGGYPGGSGGGSGEAGHGGSNYVDSSVTTLVNNSNGSSGRIGNGNDGKITISWDGGVNPVQLTEEQSLHLADFNLQGVTQPISYTLFPSGVSSHSNNGGINLVDLSSRRPGKIRITGTAGDEVTIACNNTATLVDVGNNALSVIDVSINMTTRSGNFAEHFCSDGSFSYTLGSSDDVIKIGGTVQLVNAVSGKYNTNNPGGTPFSITVTDSSGSQSINLASSLTTKGNSLVPDIRIEPTTLRFSQ